ncbi:hypothetical protein Vafri_5305 [Volvox africanus]|uniref:Uncharacterized protein n=1 Tax=Volvox africanus TaxID=51714 RepID=A0A8J4AX51_9CHLO|nr:hypothetical protein Vafri_5305 [Volvox africanus]
MVIFFNPSSARYSGSTQRHELRLEHKQTHVKVHRRYWLSSQREATRQYHLTSPFSRIPVRQKWPLHAGAMDAMPTWTLDQIAGLMFGAVMIAAILSARQVDAMVAKAQRRQLGLCEECGGVFEPGNCKQQNCPAKRKIS